MSSLIAFWTLRHRTGVTSATLMQAYALTEITNSSVLLIDTNFYSGITALLNTRSDKAIDTLINLATVNELNDANIKANVVEITPKLHVLPGTEIAGVNYLKNREKEVASIIAKVLEVYDIVLVDCNAGFSNSVTNMILEKSDIIVDVLEQDGLMLADFSDKFANNINPLFNGENVIHVINKYVSSVYPSIGDTEKLTGVKDLLSLSYCDEFRSAFNSFNITKYYGSSEAQYRKDVKYLAVELCTKLGIAFEGEKPHKQNVLTKLFRR